ncbi:MAG: GNAT family N-acetyltransferase [Desulfobacterales bacterium]|nr:MAG: GNAT family N-acetyltransferase [Desulfobacterales bacterium]
MIIRKATIQDVPVIHDLLHSCSHQGDLIPRSLSDLYGSSRDFTVAVQENCVMGCAALQFCWEDLAEIRSMAVRESKRRRGVGTALVHACTEEARRYGIRKLFCLTFKPDLYARFGFHTIERAELPVKIWSDCMQCVHFPDCEGTAMMMAL